MMIHNTTMTDFNNLMTRGELAKKMRVSNRTIQRYSKRGMPFVKIGRLYRYDYDDVVNWFVNFKPLKGGENNGQ